MKRFITLILLAFLALPTLSAAIDKKSLKEIKREAKRLEAEGWKPSVSALNIEEQCIRAAEYAEAKDKSGAPIYIIVSATQVGMSENVASTMAYSMCKSKAAKALTSEVADAKVTLGRSITLVKLQRNVNRRVEIKLTCAFRISDTSVSKSEDEAKR